MHVHGFTPLEVWQGAHTLGVSVRDFLARLRDAGLGTLPGTAAEILDDRVRAHLCPDKVRTSEWAEVMITAHELGLRATTTMMFGHIDGPRAWANHLEVLRRIQRRTGGFTEFVPLPFVHMASPIFLQGKARPGPTWDEVVLVHAVGRIALAGLIDNIQASWVKLGLDGGARLLAAGCNDLGGTLMDENISRASGASHGQLATPEELEAAIRSAGRIPARRTTVYDLIEAPAPSAPCGAPVAVALALLQGVEHLLDAAELDPRPVARGAPALLLEQVDQLPVVVGDEVVAALGQQALEHGPGRHLLLVEAPLGEVVQEHAHGLLGVGLVGADDPARAALDPPDHVLARHRLAGARVDDPAGLVGDHAGHRVEGDPRQRAPPGSRWRGRPAPPAGWCGARWAAGAGCRPRSRRARCGPPPAPRPARCR